MCCTVPIVTGVVDAHNKDTLAKVLTKRSLSCRADRRDPENRDREDKAAFKSPSKPNPTIISGFDN